MCKAMEAIIADERKRGMIDGRKEERENIFQNIVKKIMERDPSKTRAQAEKEARMWIS